MLDDFLFFIIYEAVTALKHTSRQVDVTVKYGFIVDTWGGATLSGYVVNG